MIRPTQSAPLPEMTIRFSCLALGFLLAAGCQNKGPVPGEASPGEAPKVGTTETTGAHPGAANPHASAGDPHAGLGIPPAGTASPGSAPKLTDAGLLELGAIAVRPPDTWTVQVPGSSMRKAQMQAPGDAGPAELVVFYFGPQGAGTPQDNIDRWVAQFKTEDGAQVENIELTNAVINDHEVTRVEVAGQFSNSMPMQGAAQAPVSDQRLIAAIVSTASGPYYVKFLGPNATVMANREAFDGMLGSIVAVQ